MNYTMKNRQNKQNKNKTRNILKQGKKYNKKNGFITINNLSNKTPNDINMLSKIISQNVSKTQELLGNSVLIANNEVGSYSPSINKELVLLQSIKRDDIIDCNNNLAFELKEPIKIGVPGKVYGKTCVPYYDKKAQNLLLHNLSANKHIDINKIVPPIQNLANCWFNTMFVSLFVSDKGRKFFHFFRQLMIEGIQSNGKSIPSTLRDGFALLNYAIESCLTGTRYAYTLNTNAIIQNIYNSIPDEYKSALPYIKNVSEAGNPIRYYDSLIKYLDNNSLQLLFVSITTNSWKDIINNKIAIDFKTHLPHIIILEVYDGINETAGMSGILTNKPKRFSLKGGARYLLDSCIIRDTSQQHFCCLLTCEKKEMAYDGLSYHRLVPLKWKEHINSDYIWQFEGSNNSDGKPLQWNFLQGYQMLVYYRVT